MKFTNEKKNLVMKKAWGAKRNKDHNWLKKDFILDFNIFTSVNNKINP